MKGWEIYIASLLFAFALSGNLYAEEAATSSVDSTDSTNSTSLNDMTPNHNVVPDSDDIDQILTNNLMRAQSGSKSRWSISNSVNYNGGTVNSPFSALRPNISAGTAATSVASLSDSLAGKYNIDAPNAILAGLGVRWLTPLNGTGLPSSYNGNKYDANNPYVDFQHIYRWAGIQSSFMVGPTLITENNLTRMGYLGSVVVQQNNVYDIGDTGLSAGVLVDVVYTAYSSRQFLEDTSDYALNACPFLEFKITPRVNLRSYWTPWSYEHLRTESQSMTYYHDADEQTLGVGISVTRDVFLYPNVNFIPTNIRSDLTNVGLSANINIF